ncbi:hypothetical protein [Bacillus sp. SJS]|uniref:hypothetical protein n=1 Tax=Bacillus sp. SJS TaxID=1423321 RepID=UPI000A9BE29D|nr:hypothetical protein [Bacillus sp. SJS]
MKSAYYPKTIKVQENGEDAIKVSADIVIEGISEDGKQLCSEFHYMWTLENNLDERFARLKELKIDKK